MWSVAGSVKTAASAEQSEGSLEGFCGATTLPSSGRKMLEGENRQAYERFWFLRWA